MRQFRTDSEVPVSVLYQVVGIVLDRSDILVLTTGL